MSAYFLDASALVKRYLPEQGTRWVHTLTQSVTEIVIAQISPVEIYSALSRNYHDGKISLPLLQRFRTVMMRHLADRYDVVAVSDSIIQIALDLQERHRLRAYDAIQLATALAVNTRIESAGQTIVFVAADDRLLAAAHAEGLTTDNPNNYS